jgi:hypothetical protein
MVAKAETLERAFGRVRLRKKEGWVAVPAAGE